MTDDKSAYRPSRRSSEVLEFKLVVKLIKLVSFHIIRLLLYDYKWAFKFVSMIDVPVTGDQMINDDLIL